MEMDLKELYKIAKQQFEGYKDTESIDFRLEQAYLDEETNEWILVISFLEEISKDKSPLANLTITAPFERVYKKIVINRDTKELKGLYIFNDS